jgi:hypothetical protein
LFFFDHLLLADMLRHLTPRGVSVPSTAKVHAECHRTLVRPAAPVHVVFFPVLLDAFAASFVLYVLSFVLALFYLYHTVKKIFNLLVFI